MSRGMKSRMPARVKWAIMLAVIAVTVVAGAVLRPALFAQMAQVAGQVVPTPASAAGQATLTPTGSQQHAFEVGVAFPRVATTSDYSSSDTVWQTGLPQMQQQTHVKWVMMTIRLFQYEYTSTTLFTGFGTTTPQALASGITRAHQMGMRVFLEPLVTVQHVPDNWVGRVRFSDPHQAQAWFASYWAKYRPFVQAAANARVDQLAIGTEFAGLESASPSLWNTLIANVRALYSGPITYNMNHTSIYHGTQPWMSNPELSYLGISDYISLVDKPQVLSQDELSVIWQQRVLPRFDSLAHQAGKQIVISEIGYRNATDALWDTWMVTSNSPADPQLQADAYSVALDAAYTDPNIAGMFFWGWNQARLAPSPQAEAVIVAFCQTHVCS